jgi:DNA-binding CsgD family transcriptional regulator
LNDAFTANGMAASLQSIAESVGAEGATLTYSHGAQQLGAVTSEALLPFVAPYIDPSRPFDPRPGRVNPVLAEGFRLDQDDFTADELARDPYYQEFLRPFGFGWHACALLAGAPGGETVNLTLRRTSRQGRFEQDQLAALATQLPLIRAAVSLTQAMGGLLRPGDGAEQAERRSLFGFDGKGGAFVLHRGQDAADVLDVRAGKLVARGTDQQSRITATVERAMALGRQSSTILADANGEWWLFSIVPAPALGPAWMLPFTAWAALVPYVRSEAANLARLRSIAAVFGLSPAEARVAALIGDAKTIGATARILSTSPGTVRNQLKTVFSKIGVNRQAELVAILSRF